MAFDPGFARKLGLNPDDIIISQPSTMEDGLTVVESLAASNAVDLIVVDSVAAMAMLGGKTTVDNLQSYQWFDNAESNLKHLRANQKGTRYWLDFDIDVPAWFKNTKDQDVYAPPKATHFITDY